MIITSSRAIKTTPEILFEAFANPKHLVEWWGQKGLIHKMSKFEFKPGGAWTMVTHTPDAKYFVQESQFLDVAKPNRIAFLHASPAPSHHMTMTFEKNNVGTTTLSWHMQFPPAPDNEKFRPMVELAIAQNINRLEVYLPKVTL
jgi:uncharacterized protein YndB with AHSA1/START domain